MEQVFCLNKLLILVIACSQLAQAVPLEFGKPCGVPQTFTDELLPESQRQGNLINNLGRVKLLDTYLSPMLDFRTAFSIYNNRVEPKRDIVIQPDTYSYLGTNTDGAENGPYHFKLEHMLESGFDASKRTVLMMPGYLSKSEEDWMVKARDLWLHLDPDVNIIEVSWSDSNKCTYSRATANTVLIARQITIFLHYLAELSGTNLRDEQFLKRLHLIGHSLGAHIVGFVGKDLAGKVGRITGLDPAGPTFDQFSPSQRLDRDDALLVEVIHTNAGVLKYLNAFASAPLHALSSFAYVKKLSEKLSSKYSGEGDTAWFGIEHHIGHVDYFANNGRVQDGCSGVLHICDHNRACDIYVDLLRYELGFRRTQSPLEQNQTSLEDLSRTNRLYAFKSSSYDDFATGRNFIDNCPEIMSFSKHLDDKEVLKSFSNCALPMPELTRPIDEVINELKTNFNVDFTPRNLLTLDPPTTRYHFKTLAEPDNLVGHHYLLKVHLFLVPAWDPNVCSLEAQIVQNDGTNLTLEMNMESNQIMQLVESDKQVVAIPFIHRDPSNNLLRLIKLQDAFGMNRSQAAVDVFQELFPKSITLTLKEPKSSTVFGTVRDLATRMIKSNDMTKCGLYIDIVEVHPVVYGLKHNFGALYGTSAFLNNPGSGLRLHLLSVERLLEMFEDPNRMPIRLSTKTEGSIKFDLEAVLS